MPLLLRSEKIKSIFFMVESFMACYFNYFHFYTMLWNICGPVYIEKSVHFGTRRHIWIFVKFNIILILPPRTPKSLLILILLVSDWPSKMFVMVLKTLGDHFKTRTSTFTVYIHWTLFISVRGVCCNHTMFIQLTAYSDAYES